MIEKRHIHVQTAAALLFWLMATSPVAGQDGLGRAKELYLSASYDEALVLLDRLETESSREMMTEVAQYRVFCLLALERSDEAKKAIETIVTADPFYRPSETQTSPRIQAVFQSTRKALLPSIVQRSYADAKSSFEKKDPRAVEKFDRLLTLLDDPDLKSQFSDMRTVVSGFRDLSQAMVPSPPTPAAAPTPAPTAARASAPFVKPAPPPPAQTEEDDVSASPSLNPVPRLAQLGFTPPVVLSQRLPRWAPPKSVDARFGFKGSIEVTIDEQGNVASAVMRQSIHPTYDVQLLALAQNWKYKPATRNGVPISYQKIVEIQLQPVR